MEKPKLPKFAGDVQEYAIFKADFKHAIEWDIYIKRLDNFATHLSKG
jgi:hypothetical protein